MTIRRLLIANRGEIACRIIRTCRDLGIETVLAASQADLGSVPAKLADQVVPIGPSAPQRSYLDPSVIVAAARASSVQAVHPGYGFLSENPVLAKACAQAGLVFVGATPSQLESLGDKMRAREIARSAGLAVVPGGAVESPDQGLALLRDIGLPALVKAVGGGGGRGIKLIERENDALDAMALAMAEADAAFGNSSVYLERFIQRGRHIEVQLLGDGIDVISLGDRDCSVQRRYQKLIEEAPAPGLDDRLRASLHRAAVDFGRALSYRGLGTVEFLVDAARGAFYFLEMNARIQVEHPVSEAVTGIDLVAEQIAVAEGRPLRLTQGDAKIAGHAMEFRINAEDCERDFRPSPGKVARAEFPAGEGVRVDTHIETGSSVPPFYDSLLAKIIVHGADRDQARARSRAALANCVIEGVNTNLAMHLAVLEDPDFIAGGVDTGWFGRFWAGRAA